MDREEREPAVTDRTGKESEETMTGGSLSQGDEREAGRLCSRGTSCDDRLRAIFEASADGIALLDPSGAIVEMNRSACRLLGFGSPEEIISTSPSAFDLVVPEERHRVIAEFARTVRDEIVRGVRLRVRRRDGSPFEAEWSGAVQRDKNGRKNGVVFVFRDISDRARAESALTESEETYRSIFRSANDAIFVHDAETGAILDVNEKTVELFGWSADEILALQVVDLSSGEPPYTQEEAKKKVRAAAAGEPQIFEWRSKKKSGEFFWAEVNLKQATIRGKPRILALVRDITDRKRSEEERRRTERLLRDFMDHSPTFFWAKDLRGRLTMANQAVADLFRRSPEELVGLTARDLFPANSKLVAEMEEQDLRVVETGEALSLEESVVLGEAGRRVLIWKFPLRDAEGALAGIGAAGLDVTEQRELEERLRQSQKLEAIGTFAGGIAHDFNNIIYSILGFTELAMDHTEKGSRPFRCLEQVREAGARASDLVAQILEFSRTRETERTPLRLQRMIHEALRLAEGSRPPRVEVRTMLDPNCGEVLADPTEIHQVLLNLVANAFHAMGERGGTLAIRLEEYFAGGAGGPRGAGLDHGSYARLTVEDTGHGMDPSTVRRIFEPYFTTKGVGEGTGLGLATVHGIVRAMGGAIFVESEIGRGTRFDVYLPLVSDAPARDRETANDKGEAERGAHTGRG